MNNGAFHIEALSDHFRNDRDDREGGVITLVDNNFQFKEWIDLKYEDLQTLWIMDDQWVKVDAPGVERVYCLFDVPPW